METFLQGFVISFREGLEAFLIIAILLKFLEKAGQYSLRKHVWNGTFVGIGVSFVFGILLSILSSFLGGESATAKLWESGASLVAMLLITTFIVWMIQHGSKMKEHIEKKAALNLSQKGIFFLALIMVAREGAEIAIFAFAGKYTLLSIISGITLSILVVIPIYYSLVKIKLNTIFTLTLGYLILQAGFLLGYSIHEGLSALKTLGHMSADHILYTKVFNLSDTLLNHKEGILGIPLYVTVGWYSKPEWIQFLAQYGLTLSLFGYWWKRSKGLGKK